MKVGLIGTGLMGLPMAQRLVAAEDVALWAYNRTESKLAPLRSVSVAIASSVSELVHHCDVLILMLSDAPAIQAVLLSSEVRPLLANRTVIQMGTIAPSQSREIAIAITAAGGDYLEAPVLGSIPEATAGKLQVMVGSSEAQFQQWASLLQHFGTPRWIGEVGAAAALKLALNQLIGSLTTAFALSVGFVQRQGVEVETLMEILRQSALYAPTFDKKLQRMVDRDFANPNFPTKHLLKDMNLALTEAEAAGLHGDALAGVCQILMQACELGLQDQDYSALFEAVNPSSKG
ncbi:MAG: NAD(P)-dependent oxidoreductase [Leptolyngbyaceae cyanobacterium SL_7_1]|nr:NAD(P)-dependent oxidoreductase [Leptolyngbyaceae cyanobacterium SL_7_1]